MKRKQKEKPEHFLTSHNIGKISAHQGAGIKLARNLLSLYIYSICNRII